MTLQMPMPTLCVLYQQQKHPAANWNRKMIMEVNVVIPLFQYTIGWNHGGLKNVKETLFWQLNFLFWFGDMTVFCPKPPSCITIPMPALWCSIPAAEASFWKFKQKNNYGSECCNSIVEYTIGWNHGGLKNVEEALFPMCQTAWNIMELKLQVVGEFKFDCLSLFRLSCQSTKRKSPLLAYRIAWTSYLPLCVCINLCLHAWILDKESTKSLPYYPIPIFRWGIYDIPYWSII